MIPCEEIKIHKLERLSPTSHTNHDPPAFVLWPGALTSKLARASKFGWTDHREYQGGNATSLTIVGSPRR